jgi:Fe-S oxidoreductase
VLYFVGCTAALSPDLQAVAIKTAKVLHRLGVDFAILGEQEICCGSVAMRTGERKVFQATAEKNAALFKKTGIKTIITSCAGCYRTLKIDYKSLLEGSGIEVLHTVEFLEKHIDKNGIKLKNLGIHATYHDPCHAGRHVGLYEPPRALLKRMARVTEMKTIKDSAKCCGAGGGVKKAFPKLAMEIGKSRIQEAEETGADYIVSICPFCYRNLADAIKDKGSKMQVRDLLELVEEALER